MKRAIVLVICLLTLLLTACQQTPKIEVIKPQDTPMQTQTQLPKNEPYISAEPLDLPSLTPSDTPSADPVVTPTPEPSPIGMSPDPTIQLSSILAMHIWYLLILQEVGQNLTTLIC